MGFVDGIARDQQDHRRDHFNHVFHQMLCTRRARVAQIVINGRNINARSTELIQYVMQVSNVGIYDALGQLYKTIPVFRAYVVKDKDYINTLRYYTSSDFYL